MKEMHAPNRYPELFVEQYNNPELDHWDTIYQDFDAAVDWYDSNRISFTDHCK